MYSPGEFTHCDHAKESYALLKEKRFGELSSYFARHLDSSYSLEFHCNYLEYVYQSNPDSSESAIAYVYDKLYWNWDLYTSGHKFPSDKKTSYQKVQLRRCIMFSSLSLVEILVLMREKEIPENAVLYLKERFWYKPEMYYLAFKNFGHVEYLYEGYKNTGDVFILVLLGAIVNGSIDLKALLRDKKLMGKEPVNGCEEEKEDLEYTLILKLGNLNDSLVKLGCKEIVDFYLEELKNRTPEKELEKTHDPIFWDKNEDVTCYENFFTEEFLQEVRKQLENTCISFTDEKVILIQNLMIFILRVGGISLVVRLFYGLKLPTTVQLQLSRLINSVALNRELALTVGIKSGKITDFLLELGDLGTALEIGCQDDRLYKYGENVKTLSRNLNSANTVVFRDNLSEANSDIKEFNHLKRLFSQETIPKSKIEKFTEEIRTLELKEEENFYKNVDEIVNFIKNVKNL